MRRKILAIFASLKRRSFVDENGKFIGYGEFIFGQDAAANGNRAINSGGAVYNKGQMSLTRRKKPAVTFGTEAADIQKALDRLSQNNALGYKRALNELAPSDW